MKIAYICSNAVPITKDTRKGTEIFVRILLAELAKSDNLSLTAFASADSNLPVEVESLGFAASTTDKDMPKEKHILFELALIQQAFSRQDTYDLFHVNIGDGDIVMPFLDHVTKPVIITLHHIFDLPYSRKYFSLFKSVPNMYFVAASNSQKKLLPDLPYATTIHHGIEVDDFVLGKGGDQMLWAGRGIPHKGIDCAIAVALQTQYPLRACIIKKDEHAAWLDMILSDHMSQHKSLFDFKYNVHRSDLITEYRRSKLFLFPIQWEEPFGLVFIEAMACGTPVVTYARGAAPEIIQDGVTGFLVNPSDEDVRGDFIIKKTGTDGLVEAVKRIYALSDNNYQAMRRASRNHVVRSFTAKRMAKEYEDLYNKICNQKRDAESPGV
jgi:glycosyltransferase involved in cell wall biosynthesis